MENFVACNDVLIGQVVEVVGAHLKIAIDDSIDDLMKVFEGNMYPVGQIGSILKVIFGRKILFLQVTALRMKNVSEESDSIYNPAHDLRIVEADLFCEGTYIFTKDIIKISFGIETFPLPMQNVFIVTKSELDAFYGALESNSNENSRVSFGKYAGTNFDCSLDVDRMFSQHCAVLGSTGSGKSAAVSSILHAIIEKPNIKPNIILLDPHGEYKKSFGDKCDVYCAYSLLEQGRTELKLPFWLMSFNEFRELVIGKTEFEATSQNNVVFEAFGYAKMVNANIVQRFPNDAPGESEYVFCDGKSYADFEKFDRDIPISFSIDDFVFHIDKIQGQKKGKTEIKSASDRNYIDSILRKLKVIKSNPQLKFIFSYADTALRDVIAQFHGNGKIKIIDLSGLPNEISGTMTSIIARIIFQYKLHQSRAEREISPILLVCEEAHRYVPNSGEAQYKEAQMSIKRIAKEGRKYGIGLMLVSQRPSDIDNTVLSQCNTWVVLKITNSTDKNYILNYLPDNNTGLISQLSSLLRQEAIIVGNAISMPSKVRINTLSPEKIPDSNDISFISGWQENDNVHQIDNVINRWTSI